MLHVENHKFLLKHAPFYERHWERDVGRPIVEFKLGVTGGSATYPQRVVAHRFTGIGPTYRLLESWFYVIRADKPKWECRMSEKETPVVPINRPNGDFRARLATMASSLVQQTQFQRRVMHHPLTPGEPGFEDGTQFALNLPDPGTIVHVYFAKAESKVLTRDKTVNISPILFIDTDPLADLYRREFTFLPAGAVLTTEREVTFVGLWRYERPGQPPIFMAIYEYVLTPEEHVAPLAVLAAREFQLKHADAEKARDWGSISDEERGAFVEEHGERLHADALVKSRARWSKSVFNLGGKP